MQDSGEVIKLIEQLQRAILTYQVGAKCCQTWKPLTRVTGITATVVILGHPIDREPPPKFDSETNLAAVRFQSSFDAFLKLRQVMDLIEGIE